MMADPDLDELIISFHSIKVVDEIIKFYKNSPNDVLSLKDFQNIQKNIRKDIDNKFKKVKK